MNAVTRIARPVIPVLLQHAEDSAVLYATRTLLCRAPHIRLHHLRRFDLRLAAHLDGLTVSGAQAWTLCEAALALPSPAGMFVATIGSLQERGNERLNRLFAMAIAMPQLQPGLISGFGWTEPKDLRGIVAALLRSSEAIRRTVGIAGSNLHRVDPGLTSEGYFKDPDQRVRARAYRTAGEIGRRDLVSVLASAIHDPDASCRVWAAWSAILLGARENARAYLKTLPPDARPLVSRAFQLSLLAMPIAEANSYLRELAQDPRNLRMLIRGTGYAGDPSYIPWLIGKMSNDGLCRLAGESFSMITGADLAWLDLERKPPENFESGPNDEPSDPNVEMDPDDDLPWPDQARVQVWWNANKHRFQEGARYFVGAPVTRAHRIDVLRNGYQRQRISAALYLCLLNPGTPLFNTSAPAWRQEQQLAQLG